MQHLAARPAASFFSFLPHSLRTFGVLCHTYSDTVFFLILLCYRALHGRGPSSPKPSVNLPSNELFPASSSRTVNGMWTRVILRRGTCTLWFCCVTFDGLNTSSACTRSITAALEVNELCVCTPREIEIERKKYTDEYEFFLGVCFFVILYLRRRR